MYMRDLYIVRVERETCCIFISTFSDVHSVMYYISLLLLPPDGFVLCYIELLVLTLWRFDDDVISPSPGKGRHSLVSELPGSHTAAWGWTCGSLRMQHKYPCHQSL